MKRLLVIGVAAAVLSPLSALLADCPESRFTFISPCGEWKSETKGKGGLRVAAFAKTIANESDVAKVEISAAALGKTLAKIGHGAEKIRLVGFDDVEVAAKLGLTTVRQPLDAIAEAAMQTLVSRIKTSDLPPRTILLDAELVIR